MVPGLFHCILHRYVGRAAPALQDRIQTLWVRKARRSLSLPQQVNSALRNKPEGLYLPTHSCLSLLLFSYTRVCLSREVHTESPIVTSPSPGAPSSFSATPNKIHMPSPVPRSQNIPLYLTRLLLMLYSRSSFSEVQGTTRDFSAEMYKQVLIYSALN